MKSERFPRDFIKSVQFRASKFPTNASKIHGPLVTLFTKRSKTFLTSQMRVSTSILQVVSRVPLNHNRRLALAIGLSSVIDARKERKISDKRHPHSQFGLDRGRACGETRPRVLLSQWNGQDARQAAR